MISFFLALETRLFRLSLSTFLKGQYLFNPLGGKYNFKPFLGIGGICYLHFKIDRYFPILITPTGVIGFQYKFKDSLTNFHTKVDFAYTSYFRSSNDIELIDSRNLIYMFSFGFGF